jgi:hypothetical protein
VTADEDADVEAVRLAWTKAHNLYATVRPDDADQDDRDEFAARRVLDVLRQERGWQRPTTGEGT